MILTKIVAFLCCLKGKALLQGGDEKQKCKRIEAKRKEDIWMCMSTDD